jgi:hypothetical protein
VAQPFGRAGDQHGRERDVGQDPSRDDGDPLDVRGYDLHHFRHPDQVADPGQRFFEFTALDGAR